jgi:PAS domain S-box-containing protein
MGRESRRSPSLIVAVLLVLATLAVDAFVSYRATARLIANERLVVHTLRVIAELQTTRSLLASAETGQRGYLLTRDASYLTPYNRAVEDISDHLEKMATLTAGDPLQRQRILTWSQLVRERLAIAKDTVALETKGEHSAALSMLLSPENKQQMEKARNMFDEVLTEERRLLEERSQDSQRSAREAMITFTVTSLAAVLLVVGSFMVVRRELRVRAEAAREVSEREAWLQTTLHSIADAVIATDEHGRVKFLNAVAEELTGFSSPEAVGRPVAEIFQVQDEITQAPLKNPVEEVLRLGSVAHPADQAVMLDRSRREVPIEESAAPITGKQGRILGVVLVFRDVTQRRRMQESARKSEKLAAAGRLAATIAHEINNPLEAVTNLLYLARTSESRGLAQNYLAAADQELSRVAHIARQTLGFYRDSTEPVTLKVSSLVDEVLDVYASRIQAKRITIEKNYRDETSIKMLRGEMVQILSNLIANALDALPQGGHIRLETAARAGGAEFSIKDNGVGIPPENMNRIFDAFFTTKTDVGTGLGLWVVKDLLEKRGGTISVDSQNSGPNRGTRFVVFVPSLEKESVSNIQKVS